MTLSHARTSQNLTSFIIVVGYEVGGRNVTLDVNSGISGAMSDILQRFVILSSPEEGYLRIRNHFAHHVKRGIGALIQRSCPMVDPDLAASRPVWELS